MRELEPACPPGAARSMTSTSRPSDAAYTAAASPAGPAPTMTMSRTCDSSIFELKPSACATSRVDGFLSTCVPVANDDRDVVTAYPEAVEQFLGTTVGVEIHISERVSVARQKFSYSKCLRRIARAENEHIGTSVAGHGKPPCEERPHEDFAQLRVLADQRSQVLRAQLQQVRCFDGLTPVDGAPACNHQQFARKLTRVISRHRIFDAASQRDDPDLALDHDVYRRGVVVGVIEHNRLPPPVAAS